MIKDNTVYEWGDSIYNIPTPLSTPCIVTKIACGFEHALLLGQNNVYSYGKGAHGQLGLGDVK
jgi:alpha-tubulin suppressor-like RCC1 family protein